MTYIDQLEKDLITALKAKAEGRLSVLRSLKSAVKNELIATKSDMASDELVLSVLKREAKKRKESIEAFQQAGRDELADKEKVELEIIEAYLPEQLSEEEIRQRIRQILDEMPEVDHDFGNVMKRVMAVVGSQADGKTVAALVKEMV